MHTSKEKKLNWLPTVLQFNSLSMGTRLLWLEIILTENIISKFKIAKKTDVKLELHVFQENALIHTVYILSTCICMSELNDSYK